jgi:putative Holliday junction resolvase
VAVDVGTRRVGLAISDATATLARPLETIAVRSETDAIERVLRRVTDLAAEDDGVSTIVVGLPVRLDGMPSEQSARVRTFIDALRQQTAIPIIVADERLTSREAESRLAVRERDWRKRKQKLDAAAAAIILQDYLDRAR